MMAAAIATNHTGVGDISDDNVYEPYSNRPETYIVPVVFAMIFVVGVLGNGTLVLVFIRHRSMRSVPNTYILSLALGDLLVIITCVPFTSTVYTVESWPYGELICKLSEATKDVSIGVSVFTLTALSAERYCAIVNPIRRHVSSKPFTLMTAVAIWILAVVLATPSATFSHLATEPIPNTNMTIEYCYPFPMELGSGYAHGMVMFKLLTYYVVPLCVIGCFYLLMAHHLMVSTRNMPGELQHAGQSGQIRARKKVAKMVLSFVVIFMISFLPYHVFMVWFHFNPYSHEEYDDYWHAFRIVGFCLSFINSCVNPVALYFISGVFRKHFNRYLFCCCPFTRSGPATVESTIQDINLTHVNSTSCRRLNSVVTSHTLGHAT
ncbi:neuropeptide CCHamide-2 receptor-like [Acyrthosiphon pisum]|uniref:G-protein coupled receptors family 1 profile domain-containing protein n=1 Tax=Acyrthosiphon pisum TaxID=7029 RepID=A0A8R2B7B6_ACYPI|nr:neuropeptide CCHamide-2 receptor-like [Acyrthosiphon pisum]UIE54553.1 neuropeptide CCHamide-2 receptor [Acyrthosiphon pisum]|eukprot:XP_008185421.1 PREDICTED: neuropeptide CCHamide-2 receptor-like [Acyrthosiphon pisum]